MDTKRRFAKTGRPRCVYCGGLADTNDHAPPRCFLRPPRPSNLITLPACKECNSGFSFAENCAKTLIALVSEDTDLVAERAPDGRVTRALARDKRLRAVIESSRRADGNYEIVGELLTHFNRVLTKTVQGLYFGLYERITSPHELRLLLISDCRISPAEEIAEMARPSPLRDITDEPLPEIAPNGWMVREPVFFVKFARLDGGQPTQRAFRLVRETPIEWVTLQEGAFRFAVVGTAEGGAVLVMELWRTLVAAIATPWPGSRGPLRKGRKNPLSRERRERRTPAKNGRGSRRRLKDHEPFGQ